jgi:hypothetical protein
MDILKAHAILKKLLPCGASVFNLNKARAALLAFDTTDNFAVKMDVRFAYDSIDQEKLWTYVVEAVPEETFTVHYYKVNGLTKIDPVSFPRNSLVSNKCTQWTVTKVELLAIVHRYIFDHVVAYMGAAYRQRRGIPQGSPLSPLMCSFYFSKVMRDGNIKGGLFLRFIDDHLFVSKHRPSVVRFIAYMQGIANVEWNIKKIQNKWHMNDKLVWCGIKL